MDKTKKTKEQLIAELAVLRIRNPELEKKETEHKKAENAIQEYKNGQKNKEE